MNINPGDNNPKKQELKNKLENQLKKFDIDSIKKDPEAFAKKVLIKDGLTFLKLANHYYYGTDKPIVSDSVYDKIEDILKERSPNNKMWKEVRAPMDLDITDRIKVKLDYWMGSMDKIKPGKELVEKWSAKYPGPYEISEKLDGMSILYVIKNNNHQLYTRGKGEYGYDVSHLLGYLTLPKLDKLMKNISNNSNGTLVMRGELIIPKKLFYDKYASTKTDPRSMVAGIINAKHPDPKEIKDLDIMIYEVIDPSHLKPSDQFLYAKKLGFKVPRHTTLTDKELKESTLITLLPKWKSESTHEMDGLIITQNKVQKRNVSGNPPYSRAFKMDDESQKASSVVEEIIWDVSRHGKLIPTVRIKPVKIGNVTIQRATGFNAKFIQDNHLGKGAIVNIIRSGDVIPYITSIVKKAPKIDMPSIKYKWHEGGYDIYVDGSGHDDLEIKKITYFMNTLDVEGLNLSTVKKYYINGYKTINQILNLTEEHISQIEGLGTKIAHKHIKEFERIKNNKHPLEKLMPASGCFGLGFGVRKSKMILQVYPDILTRNIKKEDIVAISGFESKTADLFINGLNKFKTWLQKHNFKYTIDHFKKNTSGSKSSNLVLKDQVVVMTGFRDKTLETFVENNGGRNSSGVNSKTTILIAKDPSAGGSKINKAKELGVKIYSLDKFKQHFGFP